MDVDWNITNIYIMDKVDKKEFIEVIKKEGILTKTHIVGNSGVYFREDEILKLLDAYDLYRVFIENAKS
jgi:hypothetical protein